MSSTAHCKFFNKPSGCRNGARCRFKHVSISSGKKKKAAKPKVVKPKAAKPKAAKPKAAKPKVVKPKAAKPKAAKPKVATPRVVKPKGPLCKFFNLGKCTNQQCPYTHEYYGCPFRANQLIKASLAGRIGINVSNKNGSCSKGHSIQRGFTLLSGGKQSCYCDDNANTISFYYLASLFLKDIKTEAKIPTSGLFIKPGCWNGPSLKCTKKECELISNRNSVLRLDHINKNNLIKWRILCVCGQTLHNF